METSTETKQKMTKRRAAGEVVASIIVIMTFLFIFGSIITFGSALLFPAYETLTIEVEFQEKTIYNDFGNRDYLLECTFNNGSEILLVLNYKTVDYRADYFSLIAADPGDTFSLLIEIRNGVYYILSIS